MTRISDLTYQVVAYSEVPNFNTDVCVDWALDMVSLGFESPSLLILAGLDKPTNYFETIEYLKDALKELKLELKSGEDAIIHYSYYFIKEIANGIEVRDNLRRLYIFCQSKNYEGPIYDFFLLYWAWEDIDYGETGQHYWEGAVQTNIEDVVIDTAQQWLKNHQVSKIT